MQAPCFLVPEAAIKYAQNGRLEDWHKMVLSDLAA